MSQQVVAEHEIEEHINAVASQKHQQLLQYPDWKARHRDLACNSVARSHHSAVNAALHIPGASLPKLSPPLPDPTLLRSVQCDAYIRSWSYIYVCTSIFIYTNMCMYIIFRCTCIYIYTYVYVRVYNTCRHVDMLYM